MPFARLLLASWYLLCVAAVAGCGTTGTAEVAGTVYAPDGELALRGPGLLQQLVALLVSEARAMTGLESVGEGIEVRLERLDQNGDTTETLATESTDADGRYAIALASDEEPASTLIVRVGSGNTRMRAFVTDGSVNVSPVSEVVVRLVLDSDYRLANFSVDELRTIKDAVATATDAVDAGGSIETATDDGEGAAAAAPEVSAAIALAGGA